ncbi:serine/threonine-protein kinase WNK4-like [Mustela lutreola]|uniref:serine/threonine-protein kinase WNK4-like n=1 Tax=Mustela lutreola TaxID=9666 RepID=UPI00279770C1|nr:serine/threonine-protein kinase WNK4-like [Mustela lutreola]
MAVPGVRREAWGVEQQKERGVRTQRRTCAIAKTPRKKDGERWQSCLAPGQFPAEDGQILRPGLWEEHRLWIHADPGSVLIPSLTSCATLPLEMEMRPRPLPRQLQLPQPGHVLSLPLAISQCHLSFSRLILRSSFQASLPCSPLFSSVPAFRSPRLSPAPGASPSLGLRCAWVPSSSFGLRISASLSSPLRPSPAFPCSWPSPPPHCPVRPKDKSQGETSKDKQGAHASPSASPPACRGFRSRSRRGGSRDPGPLRADSSEPATHPASPSLRDPRSPHSSARSV